MQNTDAADETKAHLLPLPLPMDDVALAHPCNHMHPSPPHPWQPASPSKSYHQSDYVTTSFGRRPFQKLPQVVDSPQVYALSPRHWDQDQPIQRNEKVQRSTPPNHILT